MTYLKIWFLQPNMQEKFYKVFTLMLSSYCTIIKRPVSTIKKKLAISCCSMVYARLLTDTIWIRSPKCLGHLKKANSRCLTSHNPTSFNPSKNCFWLFVGFSITESKFFINVGKGPFCTMDKPANKKVKSLW